MTRFGLVLTGGPYQTERWETAFRIVDAALDRGDGVSLFLFMDGVYNVLATERFTAMDELPKDRFRRILERGGEVYACEVCTNNRGLSEGRDFVEGVRLAGASVLSEIVSRCDRVVTL
ncbi:MAG: DsrE family protein [Nitrososphaerota archaeon]|nr:DsrE family protein [Nitrososphaerota archaeon]MDG7023290.1 DsrE family protein [Nitrososphaerota archaeon]